MLSSGKAVLLVFQRVGEYDVYSREISFPVESSGEGRGIVVKKRLHRGNGCWWGGGEEKRVLCVECFQGLGKEISRGCFGTKVISGKGVL